MKLSAAATALLACCWFPSLASAHIGSPDVYLEGNAGPYKLLVTIRTPAVIPGVAEVEIRSESAGVQSISAVPLPMSGPGAKFAPVPDALKRSGNDAQFFTGSLWMMAPGSWQIKLVADGDKGSGIVSIPVPSAAQSIKKMQGGLAFLLSGLLALLVLGMVAMAGAAVREAKLAPGVNADAERKSAGWKAMAIAAVIVIGGLSLGKLWWSNEAASYAGEIYKPIQMNATVQGAALTLKLHDPGWLNNARNLVSLPVARSVDDLVLDHDHLMHLYMLREPGLDVVYHLHPDLVSPGLFRLTLPTLPAGTYNLYADIVHQNGFPETLVASITMPAVNGRALTGDDATANAPAWSQTAGNTRRFVLPDGYEMKWIGAPAALRAKQPVPFHFELQDASGKAPPDMALYMGMLGHAAFVKTDGTVFAHIHPNGTVAMAAFMQAQRQVNGTMADMPGMQMEPSSASLPNIVSFPYGFPTTGRYRIYVQMKHGAIVETGVFDATVT